VPCQSDTTWSCLYSEPRRHDIRLSDSQEDVQSGLFEMSTIKQLRSKDEMWYAIRDGFGWQWEHPDGRRIRTYALLSPRYDGDDSWVTVYYENGRLVGADGIIF